MIGPDAKKLFRAKIDPLNKVPFERAIVYTARKPVLDLPTTSNLGDLLLSHASPTPSSEGRNRTSQKVPYVFLKYTRSGIARILNLHLQDGRTVEAPKLEIQ